MRNPVSVIRGSKKRDLVWCVYVCECVVRMCCVVVC